MRVIVHSYSVLLSKEQACNREKYPIVKHINHNLKMNINTFSVSINICKLLFPSIRSLPFLVANYFKFISVMLRSNGLKYTIKYIKELRLCVTRYICGQPILVSAMKIGLTIDGFPKRLLFLKDLVDSGSMVKLSFVMTLLTISRSFVLPGKPEYDTKSITAPFNGKFMTLKSKLVQRFIDNFELSVRIQDFDSKMLSLSMKAGPGGPATLTITDTLGFFSEAIIYSFTQITGVEGFKYFCRLQALCAHIDVMPRILENEDDHKFGQVRRVSAIKDKEGKSRLIGILDYLSQVFLAPLEAEIFRLLRDKFSPMDRTFTQCPLFRSEQLYPGNKF